MTHNDITAFVTYPLEVGQGSSKMEIEEFSASVPFNFKDVYKLLKSLRISKKINSPKNLANLIVFKKNKISGQKIRKIGEKILKKTIKELETFTNNEFKKT